MDAPVEQSDAPAAALSPATMSAARCRGIAAALILVFCALSAMMLPMSARYKGDEKFYTNAVLQMRDRGDYLTPRYDSGALRFRKPIMAYWPMVASFEALGVSLMSARVPYLLAMCGVLGMAYALARRLFGRSDVALLTVAMLVANVHTLASATRSTPDALQAIWMIVSFYGLVGVALRGSRRWTDYLWFYGGAGLTFATKGGLGLVLILFGVLIVAWRGRRNDTRLRDLVRPAAIPGIVIGLAVAAFWYIAIYLRYGNDAIAMFLADQVGDRLDAPSKLYVLVNLVRYPAMLLLDLAPYSVFAIIAWLTARDRVRAFVAEHRETVVFVLAWYGLLFAIFVLGDTFRTRYFYPAHPPLLALIAAMLCHAVGRDDRAHKLIGVVTGMIFVAVALVGLGGVIGGWALAPSVGVSGVVLLVTGVTALIVTRNRWIVAQIVTIGLVVLIADRQYDLLVRPATYAAASPAMTTRVLELAAGRHVEVGAINAGSDVRTQLRLVARERFTVHTIDVRGDAPAEDVAALRAALPALPILIVRAEEVERWRLAGYSVVPGGVETAPLSLKDALACVAERSLDPVREDGKRAYVLLVRDSRDMVAGDGPWKTPREGGASGDDEEE
ncbi:MAG: phospholipid carrier-dependent glycosyltransferase [Phycisphaera sp.]|nr:phospholipid carrier-dependent glycosyltransferase [Phycisphaera sp.]